jgi:probable phosphoglycerate mutase
MIHLQGNISAILSPDDALTANKHLYLLRHGETDLNAQGVLQGSIEADLNARGRAQADAAARNMRDLGLQRIISSPQRCAVQTAEIIADHLLLPIELCVLLRERSWGAYEGRPREEAVADAEGVEPLSDLCERAVMALREVASMPAIKTLVVTHSGLIREMISVLDCGYTDRIDNCALLSLTLSRRGNAGLCAEHQ